VSQPVGTTDDRRRARELRAQGLSAPEIGRLLGGVSDSTVRNWWRGGECMDCGAVVGDRGSPRCLPCAKIHYKESRVWTAEAVVDAIRRFAAANGRPPISTEWIRTDTANGYPCFSSVYGNDSAPFRSWNEAIRAAGFVPKPAGYHDRVGRRALGRRGRELLAALERRSPQTLPQLVGYSREARQNANHSLRWLIRRGLVVRVGHGVYALAESASEEAA
jgi:hypothetical protein